LTDGSSKPLSVLFINIVESGSGLLVERDIGVVLIARLKRQSWS
jgi:hypothetical protein